MNILIAPAHYFFSDKHGSEPSWAYDLVKYISRSYSSLDLIVGISDIDKPLPRNVNIYSIYKSRSRSPIIEFLKYLLFYPMLVLKYLKLNRKKQYNIIHHMFPLSIVTFNPLLLFLKLTYSKAKIVLGPLQLPQQYSTKQDLNIMLVGKSQFSFSSQMLIYFFHIIIFLIRPLAMLTFRSADIVVCNSRKSKNYYKDKIKVKKFSFIPVGVELAAKRYKKNKNDNVVKILCVGQLNTRKGQIYLLRTFSKLVKSSPNLFMTLVGDGSEMEVYKKFVKNHNLSPKVRFTGRLSYLKIAKEYITHDIFCLPSLGDPSPTVILEAMSHGLPVVATNVGSVAEMVGDGGIIVEKKDETELYHALKKLIDDKSLRRSMGSNGLKSIKQRYNWGIIAKQWISLYQNL